MHKRWVYELNDKLNPIGMKIGMHVKTYKTCNSTTGFSKYEFNSKLLSGVTLIRVTLSVCISNTILAMYFNVSINYLSNIKCNFIMIFYHL